MAKTGEADKAQKPKRKKSVARPFPASSFEDALEIAQAIQQYAAGQRVRRLTLFDHLSKAPESGASRQLITNSSKYGLTSGGYQAEYLELTEDGAAATAMDAAPRARTRARFRLAIENVEPFKALFDQFVGNKLPSKAVLQDALRETGVPDKYLSEAVDTFIVNAKFVGVLRTIAGAERFVPLDHALDELPVASTVVSPSAGATVTADELAVPTAEDWNAVCFYITPIGEPGSEERKHADLFYGSIVEPALEEFGLRLVRADQIGKPGMISRQIVEHVLHSRLVVADLSFHNPNVFYELALRHTSRRPTVQLIRAADRIPFDLDKVRTIKIDTSDIYSLVPQLQTYIAELSGQARQALADPDAVDNPITAIWTRPTPEG